MDHLLFMCTVCFFFSHWLESLQGLGVVRFWTTGMVCCLASMTNLEEYVITIIVIIIALKGAIQDFYNPLTAPRTVSNTYAQVARAQLCANHAQHIERLSRATCSVPLHTKGQLSY